MSHAAQLQRDRSSRLASPFAAACFAACTIRQWCVEFWWLKVVYSWRILDLISWCPHLESNIRFLTRTLIITILNSTNFPSKLSSSSSNFLLSFYFSYYFWNLTTVFFFEIIGCTMGIRMWNERVKKRRNQRSQKRRQHRMQQRRPHPNQTPTTSSWRNDTRTEMDTRFLYVYFKVILRSIT